MIDIKDNDTSPSNREWGVYQKFKIASAIIS